MNTLQFLDAIKRKHDLTSDYQLGKFMDWPHPRVSNYRNAARTFGDETCMEVAKALDMELEFVLTSIAAERAKCPAAKKAYRNLARISAAAVICAAVTFGGLSVGNSAPDSARTGYTLYALYL